MKTGRVDCQCGDQIISNSGKSVGPAGMVICWNPECGRVYDSSTLEKFRKDGEVVVFIPPGKNLKVFRMNDCDWWMDTDLKSAKENYPKFVEVGPADVLDNPYEMNESQLKSYKYVSEDFFGVEYSFLEELQRRQSISNEPDFFASTEF